MRLCFALWMAGMFCIVATGNAQGLSLMEKVEGVRCHISLNQDWKTIAGNDENPVTVSFRKNIDDSKWEKVNVPHNWDDYYGYRRLLHGNKHGDAWYRKTFSVKRERKGTRFFLFFEGVSSYATVYLNEKKVGEHAGGRTSFTIDVTEQIKTDGSANLLAVRAWHPPFIKDLPWVCGGCSDERGFSEGSQPMGIFRPVHLVTTNELRIEPFGVHAWADVQPGRSLLNIDVTIKNYGSLANKNIVILNDVLDRENKLAGRMTQSYRLKGFDSVVISGRDMLINNPVLWSVENPYLYKIKTTIRVNNKTADELVTDFGFRTVQWKTPTNQFILNGKPVFINGVAEYEHLIGQGHAFSDEQVVSRIKWIQAAGFNAFRDGHQPHNLLYGKLFNQKGILWWTQLSAHIWYDTPAFRIHFKQLLKEWVIERRNDPAVIMWGLQNESKLPKEFAEECTQLIRSLDPTASTQRLVTTCNGGEGTDWDVPQNWTGTYGGNPDTYGEDLKKQVLVGEYGAWRTLDLHTEGGFQQNGPVSEDRFTQLMEKKVRLAESVKDSVAGHFFWLLTSHDNPGRVQGGEGLRELDRVGPVNYKGMLTPWEEPTDVFYMFRSNYVPAQKEPMVYIASHTWPNRWTQPGIKDSIIVYSNCDEVELFNDIDNASLGKQKRNGIGSHFQWNQVNIKYNVLYAVGYVNGKAVAKDTVVLFHLPQSPDFEKLYENAVNITQPDTTCQYIYRVNCGGPAYRDENGHLWLADKPAVQPGSIWKFHSFGSVSWTDNFPGMPSFFASQRRTFSPVKDTKDWLLFQTFRYGRHQLKYEFDIAKSGTYLVELYFIEPWLNIGGSMDATGMRLFDVAINGKTVLKDFDTWKEAGSNRPVKKSFFVNAEKGKLVISFPHTKAGQTIISAIAVAIKEPAPKSVTGNDGNKTVNGKNILHLIGGTKNTLLTAGPGNKSYTKSWLDIGDKISYHGKSASFNTIPPKLYGADWLQYNNNADTVAYRANTNIDLYIGLDTAQMKLPAALKGYENVGAQIKTDENGGKSYWLYRKRLSAGIDFSFTKNDFEFQKTIMLIAPVDSMQPAYDLKPVTSYKSDVAIINSHVAREIISGAERTVIRSDEAANITWPVTTGVADVYAITLKYNSASEKELVGILQLFDVGNNKLMEEPVQFRQTKKDKWNYITINTGSMINAGYYKVKLSVKNAKGLIVSNIDVQ